MDQNKLKLLNYVVMLIGVTAGVVFVIYGFLQAWPNTPIVDLPPLFWLLFVAFFGGAIATVILRELKAWRAEGLTSKEREGVPLLAAGVFALLVSLLGMWNGTKVMLMILGAMNLIWGGSMVVRRRMRESNSTNSQEAQR